VLGVKKIYVYDNNDVPDLREDLRNALKPFIDLHLVHYIEWANISLAQNKAYAHCNKLSLAEGIEWTGFFDGDEFLQLNGNNPCLSDYLLDFDQNHPDVGAINVRWRNMASSRAPIYDASKTMFEQAQFYNDMNDFSKKFLVQVHRANLTFPHASTPFEGYRIYNSLGNYEESVGSYDFVGKPKNTYQFLELRHFWGMTLDYLLFEKLCGASNERQQYSVTRVHIAMEEFKKNQKRKT